MSTLIRNYYKQAEAMSAIFFLVLFAFTLGRSKFTEAIEIPREWVLQLHAFCYNAKRTSFSVIVFAIP